MTYRTLTVVLCGLLMSASAHAVFVTVGPDAPVYTSPDDLQDAVDDVLGVFGIHQVRIQAGFTATGGFFIPATQTENALIIIEGGWNSTFDELIGGPDSTVINGQGFRGAPADIRPAGLTIVSLRNLTIVNGGETTNFAGGVLVDIGGSANVQLTDLIVRNNNLSGSGDVEGVGIWARTDENSTFKIEDCQIHDNNGSTGGDFEIRGVGVYVSALESSEVTLVGNEIYNNNGTGPGNFTGTSMSGLYLVAEGDSVVTVAENIVRDNPADDLGGGVLNGLVACRDDASITERQNRWLRGSGTTVVLDSLAFGAHENCTLLSQSSLVAQSAGNGMVASTSGSPNLLISNLTAADNAFVGISISNRDTPNVALSNSIAYGNGMDLSVDAAVALTHNLIGTDPLFLHPSSDNYSPKPGSPAIDMGTNAPLGGLSAEDLVGRTRIADGTVDIGAYEGPDAIFVDGFESGDLTAWSATAP